MPQVKWESMLAALNARAPQKIDALKRYRYVLMLNGITPFLIGFYFLFPGAGTSRGTSGSSSSVPTLVPIVGAIMAVSALVLFAMKSAHDDLVGILNSVFHPWKADGITANFDYFHARQTASARILVSFPVVVQPAPVQPMMATQPMQPMMATQPMQPMMATQPMQPMMATQPMQPMNVTQPMQAMMVTASGCAYARSSQGISLRDSTSRFGYRKVPY
jgi:hypothetical protein